MKVFSCDVRTSKKQNKTKQKSIFFLKMRKSKKAKKAANFKKLKRQKEKGKTCSMAQNSV